MRLDLDAADRMGRLRSLLVAAACLDGVTSGEIAARTGLARATVHHELNRALFDLKVLGWADGEASRRASGVAPPA